MEEKIPRLHISIMSVLAYWHLAYWASVCFLWLYKILSAYHGSLESVSAKYL